MGAAPERWDEPPGAAETHISVLLFAGDRAYKLMKPVATGFLDHTTRAARSAACAREVALNRRIAPDVYLGVGRMALEDEDPEPLVVMRRMPAGRRLAVLLDTAEAEREVRRTAAAIADFHLRAERPGAAAEAASPAAVRRLWDDNLAELREVAGHALEPDEVDAVAALAEEYLDGRADLLRARVEDGRALDGHGDLLADDVFCLEDGPRILDCIAFSDRLRMGDALADIAFLAMDLEHRGHPRLAAALLAEHASRTGDDPPPSLVSHWIAYRASVRAKVACYRAAQGDEGAPAEAVSLLALARARLERARVRMVLVGGGPGTGKSTLAETLAGALDATWIQSDAVRKELAGLPVAPLPSAPGLDEGAYDPAASARVYTEMLARAGAAARMGRSVVLDASWPEAGGRAAAREAAAAAGAALSEIECRVDDAVADARILARAQAGESPSDATPEVAAALRARRDAWPEASPLDTAASPPEALAAARDLVTSRRPPSPRGADPGP